MQSRQFSCGGVIGAECRVPRALYGVCAVGCVVNSVVSWHHTTSLVAECFKLLLWCGSSVHGVAPAVSCTAWCKLPIWFPVDQREERAIIDVQQDGRARSDEEAEGGIGKGG